MEAYERKAAEATMPNANGLLGALGLVVNRNGDTLYSHTSGRQSLDPDAPFVDPASTISLGSAGKIITHIAALKLAELGVVGLDEPVYTHLPELEKLEIISPGQKEGEQFTLSAPTKKITLRHLLTHSSGLSGGEGPLIEAWRASAAGSKEFPEDAHPIAKMFSAPLLFEPGEGWCYGHSIYWAQLLVARASQRRFAEYIQEIVFDPLGMKSSTYMPQIHEDVKSRLLQMVQRREDGSLAVASEAAVGGLACSVQDIGLLLGDLLAPVSKILSKESVDLLFEPAFAPSTPGLGNIRQDHETYAATIGWQQGEGQAPVNYSCGGLVIEDQLAVSGLPAGTVTWNGMPNVIWAMNREVGIGMVFATQLLPVDDPKAVGLMMEFLRAAWSTFRNSSVKE
ncbi:beta-lactamase/transpeptidase-like protein [Xylariales sp. PMI_506]|nr:beta-lactamase/transpeptidase-like protein [Xylariales sp. PMI_506]